MVKASETNSSQTPPLVTKTLAELDACFIDALPGGDDPAAALCGDFSYMHLVLKEVRRRETVRCISGMFGALLCEELDAALDWVDRNRHVPASNWAEDVI